MKGTEKRYFFFKTEKKWHSGVLNGKQNCETSFHWKIQKNIIKMWSPHQLCSTWLHSCKKKDNNVMLYVVYTLSVENILVKNFSFSTSTSSLLTVIRIPFHSFSSMCIHITLHPLICFRVLHSIITNETNFLWTSFAQYALVLVYIIICI